MQQTVHHLFLGAHRVAFDVELVLQAGNAILQLGYLALVLLFLLVDAEVCVLLLLVELHLGLFLFVRQLLLQVLDLQLELHTVFLQVLQLLQLLLVIVTLPSPEGLTLHHHVVLEALLFGSQRLNLVLGLLKLLLHDGQLGRLLGLS